MYFCLDRSELPSDLLRLPFAEDYFFGKTVRSLAKKLKDKKALEMSLKPPSSRKKKQNKKQKQNKNKNTNTQTHTHTHPHTPTPPPHTHTKKNQQQQQQTRYFKEESGLSGYYSQ